MTIVTFISLIATLASSAEAAGRLVWTCDPVAADSPVSRFEVWTAPDTGYGRDYRGKLFSAALGPKGEAPEIASYDLVENDDQGHLDRRATGYSDGKGRVHLHIVPDEPMGTYLRAPDAGDQVLLRCSRP